MINDDEDITDLNRNGYMLIQKIRGYRFGTDAVLLAGYAGVKPGFKVTDLCSGSGVIPILMYARFGGVYDCVEKNEQFADMAYRSVRLNGLNEHVHIKCGDIRDKSLLPAETYDCVTANPPYIPLSAGKRGELPDKNMARHETDCVLGDVCLAAARLLKNGAAFYMVYRTSRLAEAIITLKENRLEPKVIRFVHSYAERQSDIFLIKSVKKASAGLIVKSPLIIYKKRGIYTEEVKEIYGSICWIPSI